MPSNPPPLIGRITPLNAVEYGKRSAAKRQREAEAAIQRFERLTALAKAAVPEAEAYVLLRLKRLRAQLSKVDTMIEEELDPVKLDRLASCQSRLAEQERLLAGRPLPGSNRPAKASRRQSADIAPLPDSPSPSPGPDSALEPNG